MKPKVITILAAIAFSSLSISTWAEYPTVYFIPGHGQSFWITNNTDKTLFFTVGRIDVKQGSRWVMCYQNTFPELNILHFSQASTMVAAGSEWDALLKPHQAGYAKQDISLPTNGVWRALFSVEEELKGQHKITAAAQPSSQPLSREYIPEPLSTQFTRPPFDQEHVLCPLSPEPSPPIPVSVVSPLYEGVYSLGHQQRFYAEFCLNQKTGAH